MWRVIEMWYIIYPIKLIVRWNKKWIILPFLWCISQINTSVHKNMLSKKSKAFLKNVKLLKFLCNQCALLFMLYGMMEVHTVCKITMVTGT